jgi:acetolactate synthase regulatory subunit
MLSSAYRRDLAGLSEIDHRVVVQTIGFDGVQRVISLLRQRRYPVTAFTACAVADQPHWTMAFTLQSTDHEPLLLAQLNRLPSVITAERT